MPHGEAEEPARTLTLDDDGFEATLEETLVRLRRRVRAVRGCVVADRNGLTVAKDVRPGMDAAVLAAMSTLIAESAGGVFENLGMPAADFILMEAPQANVAVTYSRESGVSLLVLTDKSANLGVLKIEMKRASRTIAESLGFAFAKQSRISELFVMHKSGLLLRHYSDSLRTDLDRDLLGGMLVGVQDFVKQTLAAKPGSLDQLRYGEYTIFFVRGNEVVAAAVATDSDSDEIQYRVMDAIQDFEERHGATLKAWNGDVAAFPGIDASFERVLRTP